MRGVAICFLMLVSCVFAFAQQPASSDTADTTCTFADGKQLSIRYNTTSGGKEQMPANTPWGPGGSPMYLFSQAATTIGGASLGAEAYSVYVIGGKGQWTLVINTDVTSGAKYDKSKDVVRVPMDSGKLSSPVTEFRPTLVHAAPQQCNLRIYYGNTGAWADFKEK